MDQHSFARWRSFRRHVFLSETSMESHVSSAQEPLSSEHGLLGGRPLMLEVSGSEEMRRWFAGNGPGFGNQCSLSVLDDLLESPFYHSTRSRPCTTGSNRRSVISVPLSHEPFCLVDLSTSPCESLSA